MRRSLLLRLLVVSVAVAAFAIAATAWLTTRGTSNALRSDLERSLERDNRIYQELLTYAVQHPTWDDVDDVVARLAADTGQRIALTDPDGQLIADSAATGDGDGDQDGDGDPPRLPAAAATLIDALAPSLALTPTPTADDAPREAEPFSRGERDRMLAATDAAGCLTRSGFPSPPTPSADDQPPDSLDDLRWEQASSAAIAECVPADLFAPSVEETALGTDVKAYVVSCVERSTSPTADCLEQGVRTARDRYRADPALLYLGNAETGRFDSLWTIDRRQTAATVLAVLVVAAVVTVLAGRRLVRPIRALTGAVQRMQGGDPTTRVPVRGRDEVGRLAQAFNAMAESVEANARQRRAMVSDVAHELRTPLANIQGYLEGAQDGVVAVDEALVASLLEESTVLGRLVDDLQDLALADAGRLRLHPEAVDVGQVAEAVVAAHRAAAGAGHVRLTVHAPDPRPVLVQADPARLRQALGNLVGNALRYTPPGGAVTIRVTAADGSAIVAVSDTGIGIAPEHLSHVFDRFYRADASRSRETGGSGLGLAITKHLVEAHGGTIAATSDEGYGTTFTIRLPSDPGATATTTVSSRDQRRVGPVQQPTAT